MPSALALPVSALSSGDVCLVAISGPFFYPEQRIAQPAAGTNQTFTDTNNPSARAVTGLTDGLGAGPRQGLGEDKSDSSGRVLKGEADLVRPFGRAPGDFGLEGTQAGNG